MSGIAGVVRLDGRAVAPETIEALHAAIAHRGGDDRGQYVGGSVAFVHAMLHATQESLRETQPLVDQEPALVFTGDLRIDNREELLRQLPAADDQLSDAELALAAYRQWGDSCVKRLEGDFAFAIWNERTRTLFCARDPFGVKALVYCHLPGKLFAFGSEVMALLAIDDVPREVDDKRIVDFLNVHFDDTERTFHRAIRRLPGGTTLTLRDGGVTMRRYWSPRDAGRLRLSSDAEYADAFREQLTRAVRVRMRVPDQSQVGSMLSGGLDSSFISAIARNELAAAGKGPLPTFSWIFSDSMAADEREFQQVMLDTGGFAPTIIDSATAGFSPWSDLDRLLRSGPPYAPNHYMNTGAAKLARQEGVRVLLDGLGGDSTISRGGARLIELLWRGKLSTLWRELQQLSLRRGADESRTRLFVTDVIAPLTPSWLFALSWRLRGRHSEDPGQALLNPRMRQLAGARPYRPVWSARQEHIRHLGESPLLAEGLELYDRLMSLNGVEGRYPFFDRRLAEFCISLPADQKLADGYSRIVARRAMEGLLPSAIQWRTGKGAPGLHVINGLLANRAALDEVFVRDPALLEPYLDLDVLRKVYGRFVEGGPIPFVMVVRLWSAAALAFWLRAGVKT